MNQSSTQELHRRRLIALLQEQEPHIADRLLTCGQLEYRPQLHRRVPAYCGMSFCPTCREHRTKRRKKTYLPLFAAVPREAIACITLLFAVHDQLDRMETVTSGRDGVQLKRVPAVSLEVGGHRDCYSKFLRGLARYGALDGYLQAGAIEFALHSFDDMTIGSSHRLAFIDACRETGSDLAPDQEDVWVSHAHFLFATRGAGRFLSLEEVRGLFAGRYSKPYQVRVTPPNRPDGADPVSGYLGYAMKAFTDYRSERAVELARFDAAVTKRFYLFNRCAGDLRPTCDRTGFRG